MKKAIAVIDLSNASLHIYDIDEHLDSEQIEEYLSKMGFHLSNCSWAEFDGHIDDHRI